MWQVVKLFKDELALPPGLMNRIVAGPSAHAALLRGIERMAGLLRPTLGPLPRSVAISPILGSQPPEVLDSAANIARRTVQLPDPFEDMGAMLLRHLVWRVFEQAGDGTATAAVLASRLVQSGLRYLAAGGSPQSVRRGLELALSEVCEELKHQSRAIDGPAGIASAVVGVVLDSKLAEMIGEVVDAVGQDGSIQVENAQGTQTTLDYVDGVCWNEGYVSPFFTGRQSTASAVRLVQTRILLTSYPLDRTEQLVPALESCVAAGNRNLLVIAPDIRDAAVGLLMLNRERGVLDGVVAVRAPSSGDQQVRILEDIAVLTGGRCVLRERSDTLESVNVDDLGQARQVWANRTAFGILGGHGARAAVRERVSHARAELAATTDDETRQIIRERIGRLAGTAAVIRVGAATPTEQEQLKLRIEAGIRSGRLALRDGVVPGGGAALLTCISRLEGLPVSGDERVGVRIMADALAEPMRVMLANAGLESSTIICETRRRGGRAVFDILRHEWVDPWTTGRQDSLAVVLAAIHSSVSLATTALMTDVLVHRRNPPTSLEP